MTRDELVQILTIAVDVGMITHQTGGDMTLVQSAVAMLAPIPLPDTAAMRDAIAATAQAASEVAA